MRSDELVSAAMPDIAPMLVGRFWCGILGASRYLVSDEGEVLSLVKKPRVLKPIRVGAYRGVQVAMDDGRLVKRYVHRLVLEAFYGPPPENTEGRHLDGDRRNNRLVNLMWGTRAENHADKIRHGTTARGERNPMARLTREQAEDMRRLYAEGGWSFKRLAEAFGVTAMTAHRAVRRQTWN